METENDSDYSNVTKDNVDVIDAPAVEIEDTGSIEWDERAEEIRQGNQLADVTGLTVQRVLSQPVLIQM